MSCFCGTNVINNNKKSVCDNDICLIVKDMMVGCDEGPAPCGESVQIDLTVHNDVTASPCDVVYSLWSYDSTAFKNVSVTSDGMLLFETTDNFKKHEMYKIVYKVDSPCTILSDTGEVWICMKDLCKNKNCEGDCDQCTGDCIPLVPEIGIESNLDNEIKIY